MSAKTGIEMSIIRACEKNEVGQMMKYPRCYKCVNYGSPLHCTCCNDEDLYRSKVTGKPAVEYENLKMEDMIMPLYHDHLVVDHSQTNCADCIKKDVCIKSTLGTYNCPSKISSKNIVTLMDETRKKEANDHLNKLCDELLNLKRRLDSGERSLDLYIEIMNHEFVDPAKMVEGFENENV